MRVATVWQHEGRCASEKRTFLRRRVETRLCQLYLQQRKSALALPWSGDGGWGLEGGTISKERVQDARYVIGTITSFAVSCPENSAFSEKIGRFSKKIQEKYCT